MLIKIFYLKQVKLIICLFLLILIAQSDNISLYYKAQCIFSANMIIRNKTYSDKLINLIIIIKIIHI